MLTTGKVFATHQHKTYDKITSEAAFLKQNCFLKGSGSPTVSADALESVSSNSAETTLEVCAEQTNSCTDTVKKRDKICVTMTNDAKHANPSTNF